MSELNVSYNVPFVHHTELSGDLIPRLKFLLKDLFDPFQAGGHRAAHCDVLLLEHAHTWQRMSASLILFVQEYCGAHKIIDTFKQLAACLAFLT